MDAKKSTPGSGDVSCGEYIPPEEITVVGVGNEFRGDDGAGIAAVRLLRGVLPEEIRLVEHSGEGAGLIEEFGSARCIIIIDAVRSGAPPGTLHRIDLVKEHVPACFLTGSSHSFGVIEAVETARVLGRLPRRVLLFGIEGLTFETGTHLTDPVRSSLHALIDMILREVNAPHTSPPIS